MHKSTSNHLTLHFDNEAAMQAHAAQLGHCMQSPCIIFLSGILGAGKTTLVRSFLRALGYEGAVKSPSFTLVEEYYVHDWQIYHFDFYRIHNSKEIMEMGIRDYLEDGVIFIEWPEHAADILPKPDLHYRLEIADNAREVFIEAKSVLGEEILAKLI
jgi:tRNA threonylcarbamoyladenosine biosynthesis protein TsaE